MQYLLSRRFLIQLYGGVLLFGAFYIMFDSKLKLGIFSWPTMVLGSLAGVGLLTLKPWGRVAGFVFFVMWGAMSATLIFWGRGWTGRNISLLFSAIFGIWTVIRWTGDESPHPQ